MKIIIIGAGTAGPVLAIGLKRAGHEVAIYDKFDLLKAAETKSAVWFNETGGAVGVAANGVRILRDVGVLDEVLNDSIPIRNATFHKIDGSSPITQFGSPDADPGAQIWRVALHRIVMHKCQQEGIKAYVGKKLVAIENDENGVTCQFEDGTSATGDLVVGADGTHSATRRLVFGDDKKATPAGEVGWVGVTPLDTTTTAATTDKAAAATTDKAAAAPGLGLLAANDPHLDVKVPQTLFIDRRRNASVMVCRTRANQVCWTVSTVPPTPATADPEWRPAPDLPGESARLAAEVEAWGAPAHVTRLIRGAASVAPFAVYEIADLASFGSAARRVVLVADAAHAMRPNLGVGLSMGLEDAGVLYELLAAFPAAAQLPIVLRAYDQLRMKRTQSIAAQARKVSQMGHSSSDFAAAFAHMTMRAVFFLMKFVDLYGPIANYDFKAETAKLVAELKKTSVKENPADSKETVTVEN
ncbi:hypothetical protein HK100_009967 [Physocladia obscura]|uniref:FAD-binding domain-containing protein n=1 Tax=Physocladia obscura TaxID=109957 RepID=A0AAD5X753_9FUNG|nr:hypothetical protein HK100_009967 [Physocladia obscura]